VLFIELLKSRCLLDMSVPAVFCWSRGAACIRSIVFLESDLTITALDILFLILIYLSFQSPITVEEFLMAWDEVEVAFDVSLPFKWPLVFCKLKFCINDGAYCFANWSRFSFELLLVRLVLTLLLGESIVTENCENKLLFLYQADSMDVFLCLPD